jgi:hypothetical protein
MNASLSLSNVSPKIGAPILRLICAVSNVMYPPQAVHLPGIASAFFFLCAQMAYPARTTQLAAGQQKHCHYRSIRHISSALKARRPELFLYETLLPFSVALPECQGAASCLAAHSPVSSIRRHAQRSRLVANTS